jgi:hypothetical protein
MRKFSTIKVFYVSVLALFAMTAVGLFFFSDNLIASAQIGDLVRRAENKTKVARADQLAFALRLGASSDYTVFGAKGVRGDRAAVIGKLGTGFSDASLGENGGALKARSDLTKALSMINQLPCQDIGGELTSGTYAPGVYCAPSAALAGQMVLDAGGDAAASFVFRIEGAMRSAVNFEMILENGAKPGNVYFIVDKASLEAGNSVFGTVIARGTLEVGAGTKVNGRAFSREGEVVLAEGANLALAEGYIQICKEAEGGTALGPTGAGVVYELLGLTQQSRNSLIRFNSDAPGVLIGSEVFITGMSPPPVGGARFMKAIDRRPATGEIFGLGNDDILYRINATTGVATAVGPIGTVTTNSPIGFDFNPEVDRIRLVTNFGRNARLNPNDGSTTVDPNLNGPTNAVSGAAYTNNFVGGPATTLYDISDQTDTLYIQNPPNSGTLAPVGALGVDIHFVNGFDIYGPDNVAFAALDPETGLTQSMLYSINLATGAATLIGNTPNLGLGGGLRLAGLTVVGPAVTLAGPNGLENRIFRFQINGGQIIEVPVGGCSAPILVPEGNNSIQELIDGFFTNVDRNAPGGTWFNRFRLVNVEQSGYLPASGAPVGTGITSTNFSTRTVGVNVPHATSNLPLILTFTNRFAIPAVIEICKYPADLLTTQTGGTPSVGVDEQPDTSGFFDFRVNTNVGVVYSIPVGTCTGPIQVLAPTIPQPAPGPNPAPGTTASAAVIVTEIAEDGFTLEDMSTNPANRNLGEQLNGSAADSNLCAVTTLDPAYTAQCLSATNNPGGGYIIGSVFEASTPADQTIFNFFNRTNPGIIKVCKIAGRGVPIGTRFLFEVRGRQGGPLGGPIIPGNDVVRFVTVAAGPADQGGFCNIVTDDPDGTGPLIEGGASTRFIVGTLALVREVAVLDDVPGVENGGFGDLEPGNVNDGPNTTPNTEVRVSRISVNGVNGTNTTGSVTVQGTTLGAASPANPNPDLFGNGPADRQVIFRVGRGETVTTFVNRLFSPTNLKICKVAGTGVAVGTPFTFNITIGTENGLVPGQTNEPITVQSVTIPAGDPAISAQGNCVVVSGPYEESQPGAIPFLGTFDVGSIVTVAEAGTGGTVTITSPTGPAANFTTTARAGTLTLGFPAGFNEIIFVNSAGAPVSTGFSLSGRVMTPDGGGLRNAQVILTKADGTRMSVPTSSMGYYSFEGLGSESYTVNVSSRRYRFSSRNVDLSSSLANVDFTGIE